MSALIWPPQTFGFIPKNHLPSKICLVCRMQQSLPTLQVPATYYSCSFSFTMVSGHSSVVIVHSDLSDGLGIRPLYTFLPMGQLGNINLHALLTQIPLSSPLIAILNPGLLSPWVTPSATGVIYNNLIIPNLAPFSIQLTPLQPLVLGGGIGFRITIDLSLVASTSTILS